MTLRAVPRTARRLTSAASRRVRVEADRLARGATAPTSPCSTTSRRRLPVVGISSCGRSSASSSAAAWPSSTTGSPVEHAPASSTRSTSTSHGCGGSLARIAGWCIESTARSAPTAGFDDGTDARIAAINAELADATVLQSRYSLEKHAELGIELRRSGRRLEHGRPARSSIHPTRREPLAGRPLRVIASSWSQNPRKGADALAWLDRNVDPERFELTFVGQSQQPFERIRHAPPVDSHGVARLLREHDVYLAASRDDPVLERTARGARVRAARRVSRQRRSPGARRSGGLPFAVPEEVPDVLARLAATSTCIATASRSRRSPRSRTAICRCSDSPSRRVPRIAGRAELPSPRLDVRSLSPRSPPRPRSRRARARRPLRVGRVDGGDVARRAGARRTRSISGSTRRSSSRPKPELIVETGTYRGGSALYLASLCDLVGHGEVVSIDIEPEREDYPTHPRSRRTSAGARRPIPRWSRRCTLALQAGRSSSSSTPTTRRRTSRRSSRRTRSLVPVGCYLIVEDSNIGQIRKDLMPGPFEAVEILPRDDGRVRDRSRAREVPHHVQPERVPAPRAVARRSRAR